MHTLLEPILREQLSALATFGRQGRGGVSVHGNFVRAVCNAE